MVKILVVGTMPPDKIPEATKVYMASNKPKYPNFINKTDNWAAVPSAGSYKVYAVYECPEEKLYEALKAIIKRYNFYAQVEGYNYSVEPLIPEAEAMEMLLQK